MVGLLMEFPNEERRLVERICTKVLRIEAEKRKIPLEKVFQRPHTQDIVDMGRRFVKELELVIPLILDSVELEMKNKPDKKPETMASICPGFSR